ncbi:MAG TPA: BON domain-containing protein [Blastocatellia bacterium]
MNKSRFAVIPLACWILASCGEKPRPNEHPDPLPTVEQSKQDGTDHLITLEAKLALIGNRLTSAYELDASAQNGVVTLTGRMDHKEAAAAAADLLRSIKGINSINNQIEVDPAAKPREDSAPEDRIDTEVKNILRSDNGLKDLYARTKPGGEIMLTGSVDTHERLLAAASAIHKLNGVRFVYSKQVDVRNDP